ncbi:MAG: sugar ABC transporter permease [Spirochaetaceae bacterium]|nr:MAG: sugar ABC transporter permease [Spirochaetaceae bacterium]
MKRALDPSVRRRAIWGYAFISPFIVGITVFFAIPFVQSIIFSVNELQVTQDGYELIPIGLANYHRAFFIHPQYNRVLLDSVLQMLTELPLIVIFSFLAASLLNQSFRGRTVARAIFFVPVILTSGVLLQLQTQDLLMNALLSAQAGMSADAAREGIMIGRDLAMLLDASRLDPRFVNYVISAVTDINQTVNRTGVQILIFLAGLQSISPSLYEAATIDGATGWEVFWKVTFPMISPLVLVNVIYSVVDIFVRYDNPMMILVRDVAFAQNNYGLSAAFSWVYFLAVLIILGIIASAFSRRVFYQT